MLRRNRIISYVVQAADECGVELQEVWTSTMKCIYRFPEQEEQDAYWFFWGSDVTYDLVRDIVRDAAEDWRSKK